MKKKILIGSIIAVALLTLVSFSSVVGYSSVKNTQEEIITSEWDFEYCKDYLFETIIEISNNEDVKDLTNSNNQNLFPSNPNHRLLMPFRRNTNRMSLSVEKLDLLYNIGIKLIDRLGEDKVTEIMENVEIDKPEFADELDTIIMGNDELRDRIYTLNEMNAKLVTPEPMSFPVICVSLIIISLPFLFILEILDTIGIEFLYASLFILFFIVFMINLTYSYIFILPLIILDDYFACGYLFS